MIHGDCMSEMRKLQENSIDLAFVDPPYNVWYEYESYTDSMEHEEYIYWQIWVIDEIWCLLKKWWSLIYVTYPELWAELYTEFLYGSYGITPIEIATRVYNTNLWWKYLRKASRMIIRFCTDEPNKNSIEWEYINKQDKRVKKRIQNGDKPKAMDWFYIDQVKNVQKEHEHPCEIPHTLIAKFIYWLTNKWDLILDCFAGSWSTWIVSKQLWRDCILIEKEKKYIDIINKRLAHTTTSLFH